MSTVRIDKYLWAIRLFKTRTLAATACDQGKIKLGGTSVKASKHVGVGDEYEVKTEAKRWVIKVTGVIDKRVQYTEAINHYIDITPTEEIEGCSFRLQLFIPANAIAKLAVPPRRIGAIWMVSQRKIDITLMRYSYFFK